MLVSTEKNSSRQTSVLTKAVDFFFSNGQICSISAQKYWRQHHFSFTCCYCHVYCIITFTAIRQFKARLMEVFHNSFLFYVAFFSMSVWILNSLIRRSSPQRPLHLQNVCTISVFWECCWWQLWAWQWHKTWRWTYFLCHRAMSAANTLTGLEKHGDDE